MRKRYMVLMYIHVADVYIVEMMKESRRVKNVFK